MWYALEEKKFRVKISGKNIQFANDMTLLDLQEQPDDITTGCDSSTQQGLLLNTKKIKVMVIDGGCTDFFLDSQGIEEIEDFVYQGSKITTQGSSMQIKRSLAIAKMINIWNSQNICFGLKFAMCHCFCHHQLWMRVMSTDQEGKTPD